MSLTVLFASKGRESDRVTAGFCRVIVVALVLGAVVTGAVWASGGQEPAPDGPAYEGQTVNVVAFALAGIDEIREQLPVFEEQYGIDVEFEEVSMGAMRDKMQVDFAAGTKQIDVALSSIHLTPTLIARNEIAPLDEFLSSDLVDPELLAWDDFTTAARENIVFPTELGGSDTRIWGLPHDVLVQGLIYRKSIYEKYGLSVPDTLEELMENARIINEGESANGLYGISLRSLRSPQIIWAWGQIFRAVGGRYFVDYPNDLRPTMDSDEAVEALRMFKEFFEYSPPGSENQAYTEVVSQLSNGTAAQTLDDIMYSRWIEDPEESVAPDDWGYAPIPLGEDVTYDDVAFGPSVSMSNHWVINADISDAEKQAAFLFVQWVTSKPLFEQMTESGAMTGILTRTSMYEASSGEAWAEAHYNAQQNASKFFRPKLPEWPQLSDELQERVSKVVIGELTPEQAAQEVQEAFTEILKDVGYIQ